MTQRAVVLRRICLQICRQLSRLIVVKSLRGEVYGEIYHILDILIVCPQDTGVIADLALFRRVQRENQQILPVLGQKILNRKHSRRLPIRRIPFSQARALHEALQIQTSHLITDAAYAAAKVRDPDI